MIAEYPAREWKSRMSTVKKINDVDHLKQVLISCWDTISQELINAAMYH